MIRALSPTISISRQLLRPTKAISVIAGCSCPTSKIPIVSWSSQRTETRSSRGAPANWSAVMSVTRLPDSEIELTLPTIRTDTTNGSQNGEKLSTTTPRITAGARGAPATLLRSPILETDRPKTKSTWQVRSESRWKRPAAGRLYHPPPGEAVKKRLRIAGVRALACCLSGASPCQQAKARTPAINSQPGSELPGQADAALESQAMPLGRVAADNGDFQPPARTHQQNQFVAFSRAIRGDNRHAPWG